MLVSEYEIEVPAVDDHQGLLQHLSRTVPKLVSADFCPVRFVINATCADKYVCDVGGLSDLDPRRVRKTGSIFDFRKRSAPSAKDFNVVLLIPTGVGAELGGHAGDATPVARMLGTICDNVVLTVRGGRGVDNLSQ